MDRDIVRKGQQDISYLETVLPAEATQTLAREIVKRLATRAEGVILDTNEYPSSDELDYFCDALASEDDTVAAEFVMRLTNTGSSARTIYRHYLAPVARLLGERWTENALDFTQVTIASGRIYAIMRSMRRGFMPSTYDLSKYAIFAAVPDENHFLGVNLAADLFRMDGWDVRVHQGLRHEDLVRSIDRDDGQLIGLSAAGAHAITPLVRLIAAIRVIKPAAFILVAGNVLEVDTNVWTALGADAVAHSVEDAQKLFAQAIEDTRKEIGGST